VAESNSSIESKDPVVFDENDIQASICRDSFEEFVRYFWDTVPGAGNLVWNWHMSVLCQELQEIAERVFDNIPAPYDVVFNVSPGTSKSTICSILFHPWTWTRMPHARHITASHTESLVLDFANKSRAVIRSEKYFALYPEIELRSDQDAKGYFINTFGGSRYVCTVGGKSPMGRHGHFLMGDDLIDPQKVLSELEKQTAREFIENGLPTRMIDKQVTVMFLIMQRLGVGDPTDVMLNIAKREGARPVKQFCLPAEWTDYITPPELAEKYIDGLMDPHRLPLSVLKSFRARSEYSYAGQFMQSPMVLGGGMFKSEYFNQRVKAAPYQVVKRVRFWDRACLVAGTLVEMLDGAKPIEDIKPGESVLTTQGYREVKWSGKTKTVNEITALKTPSGKILKGTSDHRIWTTNRSWVALGDFSSGDNALVLGIDCEGMYERWTEDVNDLPVYDLEVEDAHEFFANGILVHNSTADGGCYTAGVLMSLAVDGNYYVEDCVHGQWEPDERNKKMRAAALKDRSRYGPKYEPQIYVEREGGSSGRDAWKGVVRALAGFSVKEETVTGSKDRRAEPWSCQCASGNVYLVDNGESEALGVAEWDIQGYIQEHLLFKPEPGKRLGRYKDQIDASTGAFNLITGIPRNNTFRVLGPRKQKAGIRIVICSQEELKTLVIDEHTSILISLQDPVITPTTPEHALSKILDSLILQFADIDPKDLQESWNEKLSPYDKLPSELIITPEIGKKLWHFLTKRRDPSHEIIVISDNFGFQDDLDKRALSVALAIRDTLMMPKESTIWSPMEEDTKFTDIEAPNQHIYTIVKRARALVI
jgi:phage terminase large subunit-like protein